MEINSLLPVAGFLLALGGNITWAIIMYGNSEKKKYAAERDFNHLRNNQKQMTDNIAHGFDTIERKIEILQRETLEIKAYLIRTRSDATH
jgi:hypothetical protein